MDLLAPVLHLCLQTHLLPCDFIVPFIRGRIYFSLLCKALWFSLAKRILLDTMHGKAWNLFVQFSLPSCISAVTMRTVLRNNCPRSLSLRVNTYGAYLSPTFIEEPNTGEPTTWSRASQTNPVQISQLSDTQAKINEFGIICYTELLWL